jgi:hypothetical protein
MNTSKRLLSRALLAAMSCLAAVAIIAPGAQAQEVKNALVSVNNIDGTYSRQAGAHPDLRTAFDFFQLPKDIRVDLPPGFVGNTNAVPKCPRELLIVNHAQLCPSETQIGFVLVGGSSQGRIPTPIFNMEHSPEIPGIFAFVYGDVPVFIQPTVRPGDYGVSALSARTSQAEAIFGADVTLWGVPADPSHDALRWDPHPHNIFGGAEPPRPPAKSSAVPKPFFTNQTSCSTTPSMTTIAADSWGFPGVFDAKLFSADLNGTPFVYEGCEKLGFDPAIAVKPGTFRAASPTGLDITIKVPQSEGPYGLASAHVKKVVTRFSKGVTVSTSAVAGLGACSEAQIGIGNANPPACPDSSKLGNVTIKSGLLDNPIEGDVYLARQNENPYHSTFAIYLTARGPGFFLKLPAELNVDKQTGQLSTVFDNLPQLPFDEAHLDFRGGPTAPLTTPDRCGTYQTHTEFTSWASPATVVIEAPMTIDENCSGGGSFNPTLQAGVANPVAGAESPLTIRIRRQDGEQNISRLDITLPEGELAKLKGVAVCPDALAVSGNCAKASQVGISTNAIGTGAFPLFVPQPGKAPTALYLGGPYKNAPYSLIAKVPAQSGPFDFGNIVVRTAINVDPITTQVIAKSDPLPQILEGVPIQYRDVRIEVQKPDFTVNPTSCEQRAVTTTISSIEGAAAHPSTPFKVGDCASLDFAPKLSFRVKGGTNRGDFQAFSATLTTRKHEANLARVAVTLPHSEFLEQSHIQTVCTRVQFAAHKCPEGSIYGSARALTPLLDTPLEGPVYLRSSNHSLPDMVAVLNGQFNVELAGRIDSKNGGIRNTFDVIPDAPVTKFTLKLQGGAKSLLVNSRNLCKSVSRADVKMIGQNGMVHNERPVVENGCPKKGKKKAKRVKNAKR